MLPILRLLGRSAALKAASTKAWLFWFLFSLFSSLSPNVFIDSSRNSLYLNSGHGFPGDR